MVRQAEMENGIILPQIQISVAVDVYQRRLASLRTRQIAINEVMPESKTSRRVFPRHVIVCGRCATVAHH